MALVLLEPPSGSAELAGELRANGGEPFRYFWWCRGARGARSWTDAEFDAVSEAAQQNPALRSVEINVDGLDSRAAEGIGRILRNFHHLRTVVISDSLWQDGYNDGRSMTRNRAPVVDALLRGIAESPSEVAELQLYACCSPQAFRAFVERFPHIEKLEVEGEGERALEPKFWKARPALGAFSTAVAHAIRPGRLPALRQLGIDSTVGRKGFLKILGSAQRSTTLETIRFSTNEYSQSSGLLTQVSCFCANDCPPTVRKVVVDTNREWLGSIDISSFFPVDMTAPLAPSIQEVQFKRCDAPARNYRAWLDRAALALGNVERLSLVHCRFPRAVELVGRLPRLRSYSWLPRYEDMEGEADEADPEGLETNDELARFCQVIERPDSLLESVELDMLCADPNMDFSAIATLLRCSKGRLVVKLGKLPARSSRYIFLGALHLSAHLQELRIRFRSCEEFDDEDYASFIDALGSKRSLKILEFGFDSEVDLGDCEASIAALRDLVELNDSLQELALRGLYPDAGVAVLQSIMPVIAAKNRSLRKLEFFGAQDFAGIWPRIRGPILEALQTNGVLGQLGGDVRVPEDDHEVRDLLTQYQYGRRLLLQKAPPIPAGMWAKIFARVARDEQHGVLYAFLRAKLVPLLRHSRDRSEDGNPPGGVGSDSLTVG